MRKFWLVLSHEYMRHVGRKRFILVLLSVPLFMLFIFAIGFLTAFLMSDNDPIGYVDPAAVLQGVSFQPEKSGPFADPEILHFPDEATGLEALRQEEIQSLFILAPDFLESGNAQMVSNHDINENATSDFQKFVRRQLAATLPDEVSERVIQGPVMTVRALEGSRTIQDTVSRIVGIVLPFITAMLFMYAVSTTGNYLLQALVEEKENRTMEIVVTSLSPTALMAGKIIGNMLVGLTQLVFWFGLGGILLTVGLVVLPFLTGLTLNFGAALVSLGLWLLAFILISALMATAGVATTESREAQQFSGIFSLLFVSPMWFMALLINRPNSVVATIFSLFPLTAPISLPIRMGVVDVPGWQIVLSYVLMAGAVVLSFYLAGRAFRLGMLRYGKKLTWGQILGLKRKQSQES